MLRITVAETETEQRWTLEGRLIGPWIGELRTRWKERHRAQNGRTCTVDLSAVTFIDKGGRRLLRIMSREVTQFIATSIYIKRVLDQWEPSGKRGLRKFIYCFFSGLFGRAVAPLSRMHASRKSTLLAPSATHAPAVGARANPLGGKER
jgi:ABC-type transporter Mla MlaB component